MLGFAPQPTATHKINAGQIQPYIPKNKNPLGKKIPTFY
jgi:hypothetical protein